MKSRKLILVITFLLLISSYTFTFPASAQSSLKELRITGVETSGFPEINISLQALDTFNLPLSGLTSTHINVAENGQEMTFSMEPLSTGIRAVFIIDAGIGLDSSGATGNSRYSEMKQAIKDFLVNMSPSDSIMVLVQDGDKVNVISQFSSSATDIQEGIDKYRYNALQGSSGYLAILEAVARLNDQTDGKKPFIVFFSSGIQNLTQEDFDTLNSQLSDLNHPIVHTVLFRASDDKQGRRLKDIADLSGGLYDRYSSPEVIERIYTSIIIWRNQYLITYRSPSSSTGNREVVITTSLNNIPTTKTYNISLQSPQVTIQNPLANSTVIQKPGATTESQTGSETDFAPLKVKIDWPDEHPRKITSILIMVNNQTQGSVANPTLDNSGFAEIPWDLRTYTQVGQNPVSIQVQVTDELGMTGASASIPVIVLVQPDACNGIPDILCPAVILFLPYSNFLALGIALIALALVIVFRRQIASVGGPMIERVGDFVTRVTKRRTVSTPKAYLEALEGVEVGRRIFEIFGTTPIGRSRRHAELIFHGTDENSPISRLHCTILDEDGTLSIRDEDSQWGTYLNEKKLESLESLELHDNDIIELANVERGGVKIRFTLANPSENDSESNQEGNDKSYSEEEWRTTKPRRR